MYTDPKPIWKPFVIAVGVTVAILFGVSRVTAAEHCKIPAETVVEKIAEAGQFEIPSIMSRLLALQLVDGENANWEDIPFDEAYFFLAKEAPVPFVRVFFMKDGCWLETIANIRLSKFNEMLGKKKKIGDEAHVN